MKQYDDDAEKYGYEGEMTTMKCDELESYGMDDPAIGEEYEMYKVSDVDAAIAELKDAWRSEHEACEVLKRELAEKDKEIESLKASHYAEMVDAGMRERRLRRALWIARALRARDIHRWWIATTCGPRTEVACRKWNNAERKCRAKAEEYK